MIFDANVWLGDWPFRKLGFPRASELAAHLRSVGIDRALVSPAEGVFYRDPDEANELLLQRITDVEALVPAVIVDPTLPGTEADVERYTAAGVRVCRLLPSYHSYDLGAPEVSAFLDRFPDLLPVIQIRVEDERSQHLRCLVPPPPLEDIVRLAAAHPQRRFLISCASSAEASRLGAETVNTVVEISYAETLDTLRSAVAALSDSRVVFGSHTPFFYTHSALAKLYGPGVSEEARAKIASKTLLELVGSG